jgi:hypothetical protein
MSFFQNVFDQEFAGNWVLGDRQYVIEFRCPPNTNKSDYMLSWNQEPYDFSVVNTLTLNYAWDIDFKNYSALSINVAGAVPATTTAQEVVTKLNANATFAELWIAQLYQNPLLMNPSGAPLFSVLITANPRRPKKQVRTWITNTGAEEKLRFNKRAGVAELPTYMERHTIENRFNFPDSQGLLILLDETDPVDQAIIEDAGFVPANMLADWELLRGRSGLFTFKKITVDDSDRITQVIEYPAGAVAGDFAKLTKYAYSGANKNPDQSTEEPYMLTAGDLVTP